MADAPPSHADVVIPVYADTELTRTCIDAVLEHSGSSLSRLILVDDCGPDPRMRELLRTYRDADTRVRLLENPQNLGFVASANRGLSLCGGHAVILNSDTRVTSGWLDAMLAVLGRSDRIAAVCPLSNNGTLCSVPTFGVSGPEEGVAALPGALGQMPEWTELPTGNGFCMLLRDSAKAALGLFDPAFGRGYNEENDWCQRARALGMVIARANRAFVFHRGEVSFGASRPLLDLVNATRLVARYPRYIEENRAFAVSPPAHLAASGARVRLGLERWCLHPGLRRLPGVEPLLEQVRGGRRAAGVSSAEPGAEELRIAPLDHPDVPSAREALSGTGRLVTLVDTWRTAPHGPLRALRWAQLHASDAVWVPSEAAREWLAEEGIAADVQVLPWPSLRSQPAETVASTSATLRGDVLLVEPTPAVRTLVEQAVTLAAGDWTLRLLRVDVSPTDFARHCERAAVLVDLGGTSAGHLDAAMELGVTVMAALMSIAGPSARRFTPSVQGLVDALEQLREERPHFEDGSPTDRVASWNAAIEQVLRSPSAAKAEARAALQGLLAL